MGTENDIIVPVPPTLEQRVLRYIRQHRLLRAGDRVGIAVSGGADSVALLRLALDLRGELGVVLSAVHFNHRIRGAAADADEQFVRDLAAQHGLEFHSASGDSPACAAERSLSLETAARELRYGFFRDLLTFGGLTKIATAHTLDDQAETVLMRILRGTWTRGLAGIYPSFPVTAPDDAEKLYDGAVSKGRGFSRAEQASSLNLCHSERASAREESAAVVRPLLEIRRCELQEYLRALGQPWREDATNLDINHSRNRVRHRLLPLLEREFNPAVCQVLADMAEMARAEEVFWQAELARTGADVTPEQPGTFSASLLAALPTALARRLIRAEAAAFGLRLEFRHVEELRALATAPIGTQCELPDGWLAERQREHIVFRSSAAAPRDYEYALPIPGSTAVPELGAVVRASVIPLSGDYPRYNRKLLLNPLALGAEVRVRNWRPGDRFWPAHTKSPRKVKELLQQRHITGTERALWPVVARGDQLLWVRGFPVPEEFAAQGPEGILIDLVIE
ncbi:MAG: tRNA lysidine(34) synthetase TilS [Terriglobales bacterium]